ncbi:MAG: enoyl-CoA hydratase/isomerase family protein [Pseudomonadota bacterium]
MAEFTQTDITDGIATLSLARPEALNSVTMALADGVVAALADLDRDAAVKAIILTGQGRAFCAGVDLAEGSQQTPETVPGWFSKVAATYKAILEVEKPVIAAINGVAAGAGFQMALCSDMRIAAEGARLGQPEINAGLPSIMGTYWMSLHLPRAVNQDLSLTGRMMEMDEAHRHGLVQHVVPPDDLLAKATEQADLMAGKSAIAFRATKARFRREALAGFDAALDEAVTTQRMAFQAGEPQRIMGEFLAKRATKRG